MQKDTEPRRKNTVRGACLAAAAVIVVEGAYLALVVVMYRVLRGELGPWSELFLVFAAIPALIIIGILAALWERVKEIKGGEENAAGKY